MPEDAGDVALRHFLRGAARGINDAANESTCFLLKR